MEVTTKNPGMHYLKKSVCSLVVPQTEQHASLGLTLDAESTMSLSVERSWWHV